MDDRYEIIGIHGSETETVNEYDEFGNLVKEHNVARVRMFIGKEMVDEDFDLPTELPPGVSGSEGVYEFFLRDKIKARMKELGGKNE